LQTRKEESSSDFQEDNGEDYEILFQKSGEPKKSRKGKGKHKDKKNNEKYSFAKAEKILKETIKYRLTSQRYTYSDFHEDIANNKVTELTAEEIIEMLSNEPFFLSEDHLKMVVFGLFERSDLVPEDTMKVIPFLKKMKTYIGDILILAEEEIEAMSKEIQTKLRRSRILKRLEQEAKGQEISKKGFMKVLKESGGLNQEEIEQCLAEASVISIDIAHINYL
jgi:hypothetical protein